MRFPGLFRALRGDRNNYGKWNTVVFCAIHIHLTLNNADIVMLHSKHLNRTKPNSTDYFFNMNKTIAAHSYQSAQIIIDLSYMYACTSSTHCRAPILSSILCMFLHGPVNRPAPVRACTKNNAFSGGHVEYSAAHADALIAGRSVGRTVVHHLCTAFHAGVLRVCAFSPPTNRLGVPTPVPTAQSHECASIMY